MNLPFSVNFTQSPPIFLHAVQARGEGMSGYYRMITKHGQFVWLQTRATMMFDSHTGNPSYIVCMNFIIKYDDFLDHD